MLWLDDFARHVSLYFDSLSLSLSLSHSYALPPWFDFHLFGVYATLIPVRLT